MRILTLFILLSNTFILTAQDYIDQKYDRQKIIMDDFSSGCYNEDPSDTIYRIGTFFDFGENPMSMSIIDTLYNDSIVKYRQVSNNAQICNKEGKLVAFFNGFELWDRYGQSQVLDIFFNSSDNYPWAAIWHNSSLMLPIPGRDSFYILLSPTNYEFDSFFGVKCPNSISGLIFRENHLGRLQVIEEIPNVVNGLFKVWGTLSATRHANGRDWWVIAPDRKSNIIRSLLLDDKGIKLINEQELSEKIVDDCYSPTFSPDGKWYTRSHIESISMYKKLSTAQFIEFDRCDGLFSKVISFKLNVEDTAALMQILFEKNSRYFYLMNTSNIYQGDIYSDNLSSSLIKVGNISTSDFNDWKDQYLACSFLAPDDKIYIFDGNNNFGTSVINNPSKRGLQCNFQYQGIKKPACTGMCLGNMPNFNLGPIDGSPCDTLGLDNPLSTSNNKPSLQNHLYPNPTTGLIYLDIDPDLYNVDVKIIDIQGRVVLKKKGIDIRSGIDLSNCANGIYFVKVGDVVRKVVKM